PNVGKSTLLSVVSRANPKIANYHFTTLVPLLGLVSLGEERSFVMADIPGLIEGASKGVGLGYDFLRHIDRCRMLVHVVDVSGIEGRDPKQDFEIISNELASFSQTLAQRPTIVVGNKSDIVDEAQQESFREYIENKGYKYFSVSAVTRKGIDILLNNIYTELVKLPPVVVYEPDYIKPEPIAKNSFTIEQEDDNFYIDAVWLEKILATTNVNDYESLQYFQRVITDSGIVDKLLEMGAKQDDTIHIGEYQFDYIE
ncbi:MAG: Obg family GTPase CgtA, partial [Oscillospiraceae bacterium]|nr:Obg family GTPase CgtA [Oscillospiraceae bacterium]